MYMYIYIYIYVSSRIEIYLLGIDKKKSKFLIPTLSLNL